MWLILQQDNPDDYVIATGETKSIREFLDIAFKYVGIENLEPYIKVDPKFFRPAEVDILRGDYSKAHKQLDWYPKTTFEDLVKIMINNDLKILKYKNTLS
jgi:GDPmannose 4,6-dehydratase